MEKSIYNSNEEIFEKLKGSMVGPLPYSLMNDFLSKYSLQEDLFALAGLLAALLKIPIDSITNIYVLNPITPGEHIADKDYVLDIKLELNHEKLINIEIQSRYQSFWPERSIAYLSSVFNHLSKGENYINIKPCIHISILQNDLFKENDYRYTGKFYSEYRILETEEHTEYSSKFEFRVLSLSQIENADENDKEGANSLYYWAKLFSAGSWEELMEVAVDNPRMQSFVGTVRKLTAEEKIAQACEARERYELDMASYAAEIENTKKEVAELEVQIADKKAEIADKDAEIADKDAKIAEKDAEIARLKAIIEGGNQ